MTHIHQTTAKLADAAAGVSLGGASISWLAEVNEWIQLVVGLVAIVAGVAAAYFHITKTRLLKEKSS